MDTKAKAHTNMIFNGLLEAVQIVNTRNALGQNKTIKKLFKSMVTYLAIKADETMLTIKIRSIFFEKDTETLYIYAIKNGSVKYPIKCKRTGLANFAVATEDNDGWIEYHVRKWLSLKIETDLPTWFTMRTAQASRKNAIAYEKDMPPVKRKTGGENPGFTYLKPGSEEHLNIIMRKRKRDA